MSKLRCHIAISLDGFVAGPNQSEQNPLGEGGERLHGWMVPLGAWRESHGAQGGEVNESTRIMEETRENVGAGVMGRTCSGPWAAGIGAMTSGRAGGGQPALPQRRVHPHHHPRDPVEMDGGTTYHFVTDGIERALELATEAANGRHVRLWGGAQAIQQYMAAGLLDELELHVVPVLLCDGERLFDNLRDAEPQLEQIRAIEAPGVTHVKYELRPARGRSC